MTVSKRDCKFEQLVQEIEPQSRLLRVWPLSGGISARVTALEIAGPDGRTKKLVVRRLSDTTLNRNPRAAIQEFRILDRFDRFFLPQTTPECTELWRKRRARIDESLEEGRIRDTLESAGPLEQRYPPTLLHGDFWPGNTLWQDGTLVAVVDSEDAMVGDPPIDLAISRLDIVWIFGIDAMHALTQHYQFRMSIDYANLPFWDLCAALRFIRLAGASLTEWAAFFAPYGRSDITEQTMRHYYGFFVTHAFAELALH